MEPPRTIFQAKTLDLIEDTNHYTLCVYMFLLLSANLICYVPFSLDRATDVARPDKISGADINAICQEVFFYSANFFSKIAGGNSSRHEVCHFQAWYCSLVPLLINEHLATFTAHLSCLKHSDIVNV